MPQRHIDNVDVTYYLMLLDRDGAERPELDGSLLNAKLAELVKDGVTDVFLASHGWMGDIPAAISQYDRWIAKMAQQSADRAMARALVPEFKALTIGIHWPSMPWGDENAGSAVLGDDGDDALAREREMPADALVDRYADRIADTPAARDALDTILVAADDPSIEGDFEAGELPDWLEAAYQTLFREAGLSAEGAGAAPGADQDQFSPAETARQWVSAIGATDGTGGAPGSPGVLGRGLFGSLRDLVLGPVRQVSFWAMKHRARDVGERAVHTLVRMLQQQAPDARIHLMGHSFGCIVVSAAVAGPMADGRFADPLPRPVDSLFLVQGAMSLWSFAGQIPFESKPPGFYRAVCVEPRIVAGPVVTTLSSHDSAVGTFFPLAARAGGELTLGPDDYPEYGGTGAFGIQGTEPTVAHEILAATSQYRFAPGTTYNIDASSVIANGGGPSGAHSDIVHDQVAHIFWQAALSSLQ